MIENLLSLTNCYVTNCKKEYKARKALRTKWFNNTEKLHEDYKNKKITKKELIKKLNKIDEEYLNSVENFSLHKCEINKCYKLVKKHLDYLYEKNKEAKKNKYTAEDYVNIMKINNANKKIVYK